MRKELVTPTYISPAKVNPYHQLDRRDFLRGAAGTALGAGVFGAGVLGASGGTAGAATNRVTTEIESIILAAYAEGRSSVVVPPGTYECPNSVRLAGISGMEIVVDGVTITRARPAGTIPKTLEFWSLAACSDLRIVGDMTISSWKPFVGGYYPLWEGHHAFGIHACERVTIEGARIRGVWGDFFYLRSQGRKLNYRPNRDLQLIDIDADDCGRHSIGMHAIDGLEVVRGTFSNWHRTALNPRGIDYEILVPEDYHANISISPETQWIRTTTALRA